MAMRGEESNNRMMVDARGRMMRIIFIIFCACLIAALLGASAVAQNVSAGTGNETSGDNQSNTGAAVTYIPGANGNVAGDLTPAPTAGAANASGSAMQGAVYHVSVDGNNTGSGGEDQPWGTIQHAVDTAGPGDTILVHEGNYTGDVEMVLSGEEGRSITLTGAPGEKVGIHGGIGLQEGASYIVVRNMSLDNYSAWGITLYGGNHHVHLANMSMTGGDAGIRMTVGSSGEDPAFGPVTDVTIENCTIRDVLYTAVDGTPGPCERIVFRGLEVSGSGLEESYGADGIAVERGQDILVEDCRIHDNGGDGIDLNSRDTEGNVSNITVRNNEVYRNHYSGIKLWAGGLIENNVVWGQGEGPIAGGDYPCTMEILNNSVAYNGYDPEFGTRGYALTVGYTEAQNGTPVRLRLTNNIFAFNSRPSGEGGHTGIYLGPGVDLLEERDNVYYSRVDGEIFAQFLCNPDRDYDTCDITRKEIQDGTWARLTGQGEGDLTVDPQFVSGWPNVDLHLKPGSPAAGHGAYPEAENRSVTGETGTPTMTTTEKPTGEETPDEDSMP